MKRLLPFFYLLLAAAIGILAGIADTIFGRVLLAISSFRTAHYQYLLIFLPPAGLLIVWLYHRFSRLSLKGMTLVFEAGQKKREALPLLLAPLVMLCTWITHLFGGSAGREGVAVQIGAVLSHTAACKLKLSPEGKHIMLVAGMAAGFGGLFQTPLAAAFFAIEVITCGYLDYRALPAALTASYVAAFTSQALGLEKFTVNLSSSLPLVDGRNLFLLLILGIAFGLTGRLFSFLLGEAKKRVGEKLPNPYLRIGLASIPLAILLILLHAGRYCGLGTNLISLSLEGGLIYPYDFALKLLFTILTLALGFQGGEVTPLFSIGASLGVLLGNALQLPPEVCAALGYAAVFGSATNTLIAPVLIGLEVFGAANMPQFVIVCVLAHAVNQNRSIYSTQEKLEL